MGSWEAAAVCTDHRVNCVPSLLKVILWENTFFLPELGLTVSFWGFLFSDMFQRSLWGLRFPTRLLREKRFWLPGGGELHLGFH